MSELLDSWHYVGKLEDIPKGKKRCFEASGHSIVACRIYDEVYLVKNLCPHLNQPVADGRLMEYELSCPYHNASFDVRNGKVISGPSVWPIETYQCKIIDGEIYAKSKTPIDPAQAKDPRL